MSKYTHQLQVSSEIGTLRRLLVHSPDSGLGKVVPSKAQDWLFEDIVHLDTIRKKEYDFYTKILLYFLDPEKIQGKLKEIDSSRVKRSFYKPDNEKFFRSDKVIELQWLLAELLQNHEIKMKLTASVCAIENCSYDMQKELLDVSPVQLAKTFITGTLGNDRMIFAPIPNFIFTRDIGIVINNFVLLNKPAKKARTREALLAKYIFFNHSLFKDYHDNIIEIPDTFHHFLLPKEGDEHKVTLEGGDVMVVSKDHLLIGVSERTTMEAAHQAIKSLFEKNVVKKISVVKIPKKRDYMHIDTIQRVLEEKKKDEKLTIIQFKKKDLTNPKYYDNLEDLLTDIRENDLNCEEKVKFIYSGNNEFPFDAREQWTDSCNLLALKEGVILGYDLKDRKIYAYKENGYIIIHYHDLFAKLETAELSVDKIRDTVILMPSAELSRARGGFHCMSMRLLRDGI